MSARSKARKRALDVLFESEQRGVDPEIARRFGLGYAPESWNALLSVMGRQGVSEDVLVQAGLILSRQNLPILEGTAAGEQPPVSVSAGI